MKEELNLSLPLPPSVNSYMDYKVRRVGKKFKVESYPSAEYAEFTHIATKIIKDYMKDAFWDFAYRGEYIRVEVTVYFNRLGMDADNIFKCLLDTLERTQLIYQDDSYVLPVIKNVYIDKDNPHVEVKIYKDEKIGVFDNVDELEEFEECNCKNCSKNKEHCAVYKGFLENRVHDLELDVKKCKRLKEYKSK